ncbi:hypothetical protein GC098_14135 [Paenibacillus sp. LMG 31458]|uniref:RiboL-PSP-HEPN domain-containing protein n=1 Tax=Paenibacillus phytorum TaxID=2654977 RepID=A0ABX1XVH4_9BACL|nr:hypothetical protein [Paenibacillus phytorum]NOU72552.1 hypothetical protein [Paenibacillus phytorum]
MTAFIYLPGYMRESLKNAITFYVNTYTGRIASVFDNVEEEANEKAEEYFEESGRYFDPDRHDPADIAEEAMERGLEYWQGVTLFQYNLKMMSIATLYQFWEQQIRKLAFEELTRHHRLQNRKGKIIDFPSFCTKFADIEAMLKQCGVDVSTLASWDKINELRHLQNVIKHGDGPSAKELAAIRPDFFAATSHTRLMDLYLTTLNEKVLAVDDNEIVNYRDAIHLFWDELPERMYLKP